MHSIHVHARFNICTICYLVRPTHVFVLRKLLPNLGLPARVFRRRSGHSALLRSSAGYSRHVCPGGSRHPRHSTRCEHLADLPDEFVVVAWCWVLCPLGCSHFAHPENRENATEYYGKLLSWCSASQSYTQHSSRVIVVEPRIDKEGITYRLLRHLLLLLKAGGGLGVAKQRATK